VFSSEVGTLRVRGLLSCGLTEYRWHKQFADIGKQSVVALKKYKEEVQAGKFPAEEHVRVSFVLVLGAETMLTVYCRRTRCRRGKVRSSRRCHRDDTIAMRHAE
jgi:hypothetical protein